jgi:hypothetical protein
MRDTRCCTSPDDGNFEPLIHFISLWDFFSCPYHPASHRSADLPLQHHAKLHQHRKGFNCPLNHQWTYSSPRNQEELYLCSVNILHNLDWSDFFSSTPLRLAGRPAGSVVLLLFVYKNIAGLPTHYAVLVVCCVAFFSPWCIRSTISRARGQRGTRIPLLENLKTWI